MTRRRRTKISLYTVVIAVLAALGAGAAQSGRAELTPADQILQPGYYRVVSVSDGDTITVQIGGRNEAVRMIGVDTPETHDPRKPVQCFGKAASQFTKDAMQRAGQVRLEASTQDNDRDKYQRLLRYVYLPNGTLHNAALIQQGYGFAYTVFPHDKLEAFRALEREARQEQRGLWSGCVVDDSKDVKQTAPQ